MLDALTKRDGTLWLLTELGVVTAQGDELLADGTPAVGLPPTLPRVLDHPFHFLTRRKHAVGIAALASMDKTRDASLNGNLKKEYNVLYVSRCLWFFLKLLNFKSKPK